MKNERFKELEQRCKDNKMQLCYEYFCNEKGQIPFQLFQEIFPIWITQQFIDELLFSGDIRGITEKGLNVIVNYLKEQHYED